MSGRELIEWLCRECEFRKVPPTDSAMILVLREMPDIEVWVRSIRHYVRTKHTCQEYSPNSSVPYSDGPCMECAKDKGLQTGLDDGPPNSICMCGRGTKCPIHRESRQAAEKGE